MAIDSGDEDTEPPRVWVERLQANRESIQRILDEVHEQQLLGEHETVREQLRSLASAQKGVFHVITLVVLEVDGFYEDLRAQYRDEESPPVEELEALGERYASLASEIELTFVEMVNGYHNPGPSTARRLRYSESMNMPKLAFDIYSGDVFLSRFEHPPSQALTLAGLIVDGVAELLEEVDTNNDEISPAELERAESVVQQFEGDLNRVREYLESAAEAEMDGEPVKPEEDPDRYQDWGVY